MSYSSDLTDEEWARIEPFFLVTNNSGHRRIHSVRIMLNAIFYIAKTGCQWRMLPKEYPNWKTTYNYFSRLNESGKWEKILDDLNKQNRVESGRSENPSLVLLDSQSVKTIGKGKKGYDGGKKVKGRKRTIATDTQGNLLAVSIDTANVHDVYLGCNIINEIKKKLQKSETS